MSDPIRLFTSQEVPDRIWVIPSGFIGKVLIVSEDETSHIEVNYVDIEQMDAMIMNKKWEVKEFHERSKK